MIRTFVMRHGAEKVRTVVGHRGGSNPETVYWIKDLGIWLGCKVIAKSRYWNAFGTQDPKQQRMVQIRCEVNCDHGIIVNRLRGRLQKDGYKIGKDKFRDLYVHAGGAITSLFEVKPDTSPTSICAAIGQLLFHRGGQAKKPNLILVAPEELSGEARGKLKNIGIDFLGFRWVDSEPDFPDLASWHF